MAILNNLTINDTGHLTVPSGTLAQRPSNTVTVVSFTSVGTTSWAAPAGVTSVEVLVVAGGGGGGNHHGGAGGGGGVIYRSGYPVTPGTSYTVTVGNAGGGSSSAANGTNGGNSVFGPLLAIGGGGGGTYPNSGNSGGSGGGGTNWTLNASGGAGTVGQGFPGGSNDGGTNHGGGGGGAGGSPRFSAQTLSNNIAGNDGGPGILYSITGTPSHYAGGGGAGTYPGYDNQEYPGLGGVGGGGNGGQGPHGTGTNATAAGTNTGGGGGATASNTNSGGNGGTGIVVIRYALSATTTNPTAQLRLNTDLRKIEVFEDNVFRFVQPKYPIVTAGLWVSYDADEFSSGSTVYDSSGNGINATLVGNTTHVAAAGTEPAYFDLDGTNSTINLTLDLRTSWTFECWVKMDSVSSFAFLGQGTGSVNDGLHLFHSSANRVRFGMYGNDSDVVQLPTYTDKWYHYVWSYDHVSATSNFSKRGYRDGTELIMSVQSGPAAYTGNTVLRIGATYGTGGSYANGRYAQMRFYNRVLSPEEVKQNYDATSWRFPNQAVNKTQGILTPRLAGWRRPTTSFQRGTLSKDHLVWQATGDGGYSSVIWGQVFEGDFRLIAQWAHNYRGIGFVYGRRVSLDGFTGYSADGVGPYFGALNTSGFYSGYPATYFGQYHAPIGGDGANQQLWFIKWERRNNFLTLQYGTSEHGPWNNFSSSASQHIESKDRVICGCGEASGDESSPLIFISLEGS